MLSGLLVLFCVMMVLGTWLVVKAVGNFTFRLTAKGKFTVAAILLVTASSLPELFVVLAALISGRVEVSLANLLGANVADLSLVVGGAALMVGSIPIIGDYWRWELAATFLAGVAPILLMMDGSLSRVDGLILLTIYLVYIEGLVVDGKRKSLAKMGVERPGIMSWVMHRLPQKQDWSVLKLVIGLLILAFAAYGLVGISDKFGTTTLSPVVFGLLIVSLVTTLPEFLEVFSGAVKKSTALVLTNLLGSVVTNATLLIGLLALLHPTKVENISNYSLVNLAFVIIFGLFWMFTSTKKKIERWEGLILVGLYATFVGLVLLLPSI